MNKQAIQNLYNNLRANATGFDIEYADFEKQIQDEQKRKNLHKNLIEHVDGFDVDYPTFTQKLGFDERQSHVIGDDSRSAAFGGMADPIYSGMYNYHQAVKDKEDALQREEAARLPISQADKERDAEIRRLTAEGAFTGEPNGTTLSIDPNTGSPVMNTVKGQGLQYHPEYNLNQAEIDRLKAEQPSYMTREVKTPQDLLAKTAEAWSANTPEGQNAKEMLELGLIDKEEYTQMMVKANEDYINQQNRILGQKATNAAIADISKNISPIVNQLQDEKRKMLESASRRAYTAGGGTYGAIGAQMSEQPTYQNEHELALYLQAQEFLADAAKISSAAQNKEGIGKGFGNAISDVDTWDMGLSQLVRTANLKEIVEKYEKAPGSLTAPEKALMDAAVAYMSACAYNSDKLTRGYKAGQTTGESLPFMLQFAIMPIGAIKDKVARGVLGYGIEQFGGKALQTAGRYGIGTAMAETGTALLGNVVAAGAQTLAFGAPKIAEGTISRMTGDIIPEFDDNGNIVYGGRENQQGVGSALWNATVDTYVENLSEMILTSGDPIKAWIGGTNLFKNLSQNELVQVLSRFGEKWGESTIGKIAGRMQFRNYPEEVLEEYVGNMMRWGMSTDVHSAAEAGLDIDSQIDIWLGLGPTSIAFAGLGLGEYSVMGGIDRFQSSQAARKLRKIMFEGEERKYLESLLKAQGSDEFKFAAHDVVKSILRNGNLSAREKRAYLDNLYIAYQSQVALEAENAQIADEVKEEVKGITNKNNGYVYPVALASDNEVQGYIVAGNVVVDETDPTKPSFGNDELVTVKLNDGRVVQLSTRELDLTGTPQMAQEVFNERADERIQTRKNLDQSMKAFHAGDGCLIKVPNAETGVEEELPSKIISVTDEGVQVEIMASDGTLIPVLIPHDEALATISVVTLKEDKQEQPLGEQQTEEETEGETEGEPEEENIVEFDNGTKTMRTVDNGDGTYTYTEKDEDGVEYQLTQTADWFVRNGFAVVESEKQEDTIDDTTGGRPEVKKPVVPNLQTMSADEYVRAVVEDKYKGNRAKAQANIAAQLNGAKTELQATQREFEKFKKKGITSKMDSDQWDAQYDQYEQQIQGLTALVSKLEESNIAAAHYKTQAELQAEADRKAREAALREQRRQLAEAETAGDIETKWQNTKKTVGFAATKTLPNGQKVNGHYILTEAGDVVPSHDPRKNYADSEGYVMENGQNVNDNNYKDPDVQRIALDIAQNYGGQAVEQMPFLENRAGRVLSGNNRTISGIIAAENNTDQAYLAALAENAQQYGFTPEQLAEYEHPRLQFVVEDELPFTTATFAMFNQQEKKTKNSVNRAVANSKMVTEAVRDKLLEIMDQYESLDSFFGSSNAASAITQTLINEGLMTKQEVAEKMDDSGIFNQTGKEYVTDMLLGTLFDEQTIRMLAGEKTLKQAILRALPSIVENRRLKGYELTENIDKAISLLYEARKANKGKSTAEAFQLYLRQVDAFKGKVKDNFSEFEIILAGEMANGVERTRDLLNMYNNSAENEANGQDSLFDKRTPEDIKQQVYEHYAKQQPELTAAINGAAVERAESQSSVPSSTEELGEVRQVISPEQLSELRQQAQEFSDKLGVPIVVFDNINDVPDTEKAAKEIYVKEGNNVDAWMSADGKTIYVNANSPEIQSEGGLRRKVFHEIVAHKGLRQLMGNQVFDQLCAYVWETMPVDQRVKYYDYAQQNYPGRSENELRLIAADEYMAFNAEQFTSLDTNDQSETAKEVRTIWQKIADKLRELLDKILGDSRMSDDFFAELYKISYNNLRQRSQTPKEEQPEPIGESTLNPQGKAPQTPMGSEKAVEIEKVIADFKKQYPDPNVAIFFRNGKTYDIYGEDAVKAAEILGVEPTEKDGMPFVSFPTEDVGTNLRKFIAKGVKVGIASHPAHKPSKGDYQQGDKFIYDGSEATIRTFNMQGEAVVNVGGRYEINLTREQLDDILDHQPEQSGENTRFSVKNNAKNLRNSEKSSNFARELSRVTYPLGKSSISIDDEWSKIAIESQRESMPATAPWSENIGDAMVHTNLPAIKGKYAELHAKAKAGDVAAASDLVKAVVKRERVKELAERYPNAIVAFPHAEEASGWNKIPALYADEFAAVGLDIVDMVQANRPHHTGSDKVGRFVRRARYDGEVEAGREYILVDDHITMGGTLRDLKDYIESKGGKVVAVSALSASAGGTKLTPTEEQIKAIEEAGITNEQLKNLGIADNVYGITKSEAREILVLANGGGKSGSSQGRSGRNGLGKSTSRIAGNNDPRFAISGTQVIPVGEKTLVGLHNISAEKLRKALKAGGLANPSAAVIDIARQNHHGYGEMSLVLPSRMIENADGTYAGDAYTPMYPPVEYHQGKQTEKRIRALVKGLPDNLADGIYYRIGEYMDGNRNSSGLEYLFLKDKGEEMPILTNKRRYPDISIEDIYKRLGMEYPGYYDSSSFQAYEQLPEDQLFEFNLWLEKYGREVDIQRFKDMITRLQSEGKNQAADAFIERYSKPMFFSYFDSICYRVLRDERDAGEENIGETLDAAALKIDELGLRNEFEDWKQQKIDELGYEEFIFNGYTPSGNRRYLPNTIENASRIMNQEPRANWLEQSGISATKALLLDRFRTLDEIRKHKNLLEDDEEKIKTAYEEVSHDWTSLGIDFRDYTATDKRAYQLDDNPFTAIDTALARLQEAMFKRDPIGFLNREYRYSLPADSEFGTRLKEMMKRIKNLPSRYFETKFRRPVYLNEFANAVVPNDLPQDLRAGLESAGLRLFSYDPNTQGSRRDATLEATAGEGIRFAISGNGYNRNTDEMESIKNNALNDGTFMKASNGKPTNLDERQWLQVRLRSFKRWFGDWENDPKNASKVVDENGEPMVVYHGTPNPGFTTFGRTVSGIYFADEDTASWYSSEDKPRTYRDAPVFKSWDEVEKYAKKYDIPFEKANEEEYEEGYLINDEFAGDIEDAREIIQSYRVENELAGSMYACFLNIRSPKEYDYEGHGALDGFRGKEEPAVYFERLQQSQYGRKAKYDGMICRNIKDFGNFLGGLAEVDEDGRLEHYYDNNIYIVSDPNQIKSATDNDGSFSDESDDIRFSISNQNNDIFYSNAERAVEGIKQEKATPEQWRAMIEKAGGLKAGEDKWIGLSDWLAQQRPTVTPQEGETRSQFVERAAAENKRFTLSKQDLLDYIRQNKIQIEEVEYNENGRALLNWTEVEDYDYDTETGATYYTLDNENVNNPYNISIYHPDGRGYIVMDNGVENGEYDTFAEAQDFARMYFDSSDAEGNGINSTRLAYTTQGLENKREIALTVPTIESWNESDEIHFGDAGPGKAIAWVRFGDATDEQGNKTLVIDEIQSKRHQEGREKGYRKNTDTRQLEIEVKRAYQEYKDFFNHIVDKYNNGRFSAEDLELGMPLELYNSMTSDERAQFDRLQSEDGRVSAELDQIRYDKQMGVPAAPFEKNWHELAMKRILRFAAENGYDKVAWTTGDQQARRYDLGKQLEAISVFYNDETGLYDVHVTDKGYDPMDDSYTLEEGLDDEGLKRTIGKDLYNRVMEQGKQEGWMGPVDLTGEDLIIGVDGMRGFYDDMLPRFMQKYGKKWGVQVGEVTMPQLEEGYQTMHAIDINDAMRESVMEGQPMFSISGSGTMKPQEGETRSQYIARVAETVKNMTPRNTTFDDAIRFSIPSTLSRSEKVTKALVQQAGTNYMYMQNALTKVTMDLKGIRAAMRMQKDYDRNVVASLLNLYNTLLQENAVWAQYMPDTTRRIAAQIVKAIGKEDITEEVNTIMDHMVHAQAKAAQRQWDKLRQTPIDKINISGVVMQGKVALEGQHALKAMNDALQANLTIEQIEEQINQLMDMENNATDESLKTQYKGQWIGLTIAEQHLERLQHLQEERQQLNLELQSARSNKALKPEARQQLVNNIKQEMRDNYIEQAEAYTRSTQDLSEYVNTQEGRAKDFIRRQDANRDKIRSYAQRDLRGISTDNNRDISKSNIIRSVWDAVASPIRDLQSLLRLTGVHAPDGEGYLYNHFMRGWMDAADTERLGIVNAGKTLDAKISELTHGKYKTWEEAARKIDDASHNMFTVTTLNGVDGEDMPYSKEIKLNAGNALYIYAVNKMTDGKMKLNGMDITEEDVKALVNDVRERFGQEILDVVDWVQSEYFSQLRDRYNPTHEALFGAPMDAIENYFPLRLSSAARQKNVDLGDPDTDVSMLLSGSTTGAIKRRTKNSIPIDLHADFFQEVIRHIAQMERWNAFAQWTRDANILFSDTNFRERVKNMKSSVYGTGDALYNYMKDAFKVANGTYRQTGGNLQKGISDVTLNIAKGVTSAKINFRVWTALKQIASFPAFFTYMQDGVFVKSYMHNWGHWSETMEWAKENLPNFEKRVSKRDMGDFALMRRSSDWKITQRIMDMSTKYGMAANVFFDTLTCATGARAVYESRYAEYIKKGYSEEAARNRARQDAELAFNTSQQSSEGAFMAPVQADRNIITSALTVFRTSPIQYTRNFFYHTRGIVRKLQPGAKENMIAFRMGQYKNDGLTDEQARKAAEMDFDKSMRQDIVGFVVYGALLNILWRIAGQMPYLLFGDDDDKKKEILHDAVTGGAFFSPFTGLLGGSNIESMLDGHGSISGILAPQLPLTQDVDKAEKYLDNNKYAEFASQALSILMQAGTGFDPQVAVDAITRVIITIDSEEELDAATQALRVSQALLSIPQSQYEQMLIDKVVSGETDEDAALEDYIRYQKIHTAPLTWFMRGEESDEKAEENAEKRFDRLLNERDKLHNPEDYEE